MCSASLSPLLRLGGASEQLRHGGGQRLLLRLLLALLGPHGLCLTLGGSGATLAALWDGVHEPLLLPC